MLESVWASGTPLPEFPRLDGDLQTDVLIVGGGLAGLLCAHALARDGVDCTLIEADRICHGVTRNTTAKITSQHGLIYDKLLREFDFPTARLYWQANETALDQYRKLARDIDCGFETKDSYIYSDTFPALDRELSALERLHIPADFVEDPGLPFPVAGAVRFREQAQFHPLKLAAGIAKGLRIYENTRAQAFAGNRVRTERGTITASRIIVATHFPILNKHGAYFLKMYQERSYVLALEGAAVPEGMYRDGAKDGLSFRKYGELLLLGGGAHRTGKQGRGWEGLKAFAQIHFPNARERFRWATQDCMTLDGMPYIGRYGRTIPDLYVATGFNKWGMTGAMVSAMVLRDLVQGRENPYADIFSPRRTMLRPQLLGNALEATVNLLTPTRPRCPHLGCALKWNPYEHSWDCPCHGSRFTEAGELLDNPANGSLDRTDRAI